MSIWKVIGGVAAGIGTVVALPIAGPVGAVTLLGATVAGSLGGVAGGVVSVKRKKEMESEKRKSERRAAATYELKLAGLDKKIKKASQTLKEDKECFEFIVALFALGMATAHADGVVDESEINDLEEFVAGVAHSKLPSHIKGIITRYKNNPPTFQGAMKRVQKLPVIQIDLCRDVIEVVSSADGDVSDDEVALLAAFDEQIASKTLNKKPVAKEKAKKPSVEVKQHPDHLKNQFSVAVVATMSAGKSTLLNAMLGFPLLPTKNEACTAKKVRITDVDGIKTIRCRAKQADGLWTEWHDFRPKLLEDWNEGDCLEIEAEGDFPHIDNRPAGMQISFFDTPGPNNSRNASHAEITRSILDSSEYSFLVCVLDATSSGITDERALLEIIKTSLESKRHDVSIVFAINKMDALDIEKGENPLSIIESTKKHLRQLGFKGPNVYPVMAQQSLGIRLLLNEVDIPIRRKRNLCQRIEIIKEFDVCYRAALLHTKQHECCFNEAKKQLRQYRQTESIELDGKAVSVAELIEVDILTGVPLLEEFLEHHLRKASKASALIKSKQSKGGSRMQYASKSKQDKQNTMRKTKKSSRPMVMEKSQRRKIS